jgi:hypothetical protein
MRPVTVRLQGKKIDVPGGVLRMVRATFPAVRTRQGMTADVGDRASGVGR